MNAATIVPVVLALIAAAASITGAVISRRPVERSQEFELWKERVQMLRTSVDDLKAEVAECHADKDGLEDELGGMKVANQALNSEVVQLRARVAALESQ